MKDKQETRLAEGHCLDEQPTHTASQILDALVIVGVAETPASDHRHLHLKRILGIPLGTSGTRRSST